MHIAMHLSADDNFKSYLWRRMLELAPAIETYTTWTLTGIAGAAALLIGNAEAISRTFGKGGLALMMLLLAASLVIGTVSKQLGAALSAGLANVNTVYGDMGTDVMRGIMDQMTIPPEALASEVAQPFLWPMSSIVRKSVEAGRTNPLSAEMRFVRLFCFQLYAFWIHAVLAVASLPLAAYCLTARE